MIMSKKIKLQSKLIRLLLLMGILPLVIFIFFSFNEAEKIIIEKTGLSLQKIATEKAARIDIVIEDKIRIVEKIVNDALFSSRFFGNDLNSKSKDSGAIDEETAKDIEIIIKLNKEIKHITIIDLNNNIIYQDIKDELFKNENRKLCNGIIKDSKEYRTFLCNFKYKPSKLIMTANIVVPIKENQGIVKGFAIFNVSLREIIYLTSFLKIDDPFITIFRDDGFVVLDTGNIFYPLILSREMLLESTLNKFGWRKGLARQKKDNYIIGYAHLETMNKLLLSNENYYVLLSLDEKDALLPVLQNYLQFFLIIALIIILILFAALYDVNKIIRPIRDLKEGAKMIGKGFLDHRLSIHTGDEIEELANAFNEMGQRLMVSKDKMEDQTHELKRLNDIKSNFLSLISHELRTPLMIIQESVSQVLDGIKGSINESQREYLYMTKRNILRLNKIIADLLNISRIEAGKIVIRRKKIDIARTLRDEIDMYRFRAEKRSIKFLSSIPNDALTLYCDEEKIKIIIDNLISNAIKFTPKEGTIRLDVIDNVNEIEIIVSDTGKGIPIEFQQKMFDKFERLNNIPLAGSGSTGLGLAIAKEFVLLHKGKIWAKSEENKGSSFHVIFNKYTASKYFKEYFNEKIREAEGRQIELSVIVLRVNEYKKVYVDPAKKRKLFSHLVNISFNNIFDYEEIIPLKNMDEIYAFLFTDTNGAEIIVEQLNRIVNDYLESKNMKNNFLVNILSVSYPEDGRDLKSLLSTAGKLFTYLEPLRRKSKRLGEMLLEKGLVDEKALKKALGYQDRTGHLIGKILIDSKIVKIDDVAKLLNEQLRIPLIKREDDVEIEKKLFEKIPKEFIIKYKAIPVKLDEGICQLAMVNPFDVQAIKLIYHLTDCKKVLSQLIMEQDFEYFMKKYELIV